MKICLTADPETTVGVRDKWCPRWFWIACFCEWQYWVIDRSISDLFTVRNLHQSTLQNGSFTEAKRRAVSHYYCCICAFYLVELLAFKMFQSESFGSWGIT